MSNYLIDGIVNLDRDAVVDQVLHQVNDGANPLKILDACREGMTLVGDRFKKGEYYLAELMLSAGIFKAAMDVLEPALEKARPEEAKGHIVLATMKGDSPRPGKEYPGIASQSARL